MSVEVITKIVEDEAGAVIFFRNEKDLIHNKILNTVKHCIENNITEKVKIISIYVVSIDKFVDICIHKPQFAEVLNSCIEFFNSIDEFEKTIEIVEILKSLENDKNIN